LTTISLSSIKRLAESIKKDLINRVATVYPAIQDKSHWWQNDSVSSNETYFENNHGFKQAELMVKPKKIESYSSPMIDFLSRNVSSPYFIPVRTFKTKRSAGYESTGGTPIGNIFESSKNIEIENKSATNALPNDLLEKIKNMQNLSPDEQKKLEIAIFGYTAGFDKGHESASDGKKSGKEKGRLLNIALSLPSVLVLIVLLTTLLGSGGRLNNLFDVKHEITAEDIDIVFDDVKGCDEAKHELQEIVDFLMNPDKFTKLGGKLPNGVLLSGPPGTGKTLLAKAVAGEAGVPYFHAAGSEFDEVFVGSGARRVRDLFRAAKARAPCVIFIDEMDSVGGKRTTSTLHPHANQTINQLLSEMDGFASNEGVIVLAATNRPDQLDKAILRPGRFDAKVEVGLPDLKGREEILELYLNKTTHSPKIDLKLWARKTMGFSGADLNNLINTAAIHAASEEKDMVQSDDLEYALDKQVLGVDLKSRVRSEDDLKITAYHEAGHTIVGYCTKDADPVHKVTIIAKGQSGGHTAYLPSEKGFQTRSQMLARIDTSMGGRVAEELIFGKDKVTGGASSDLEGATRIAEGMVQRLAMSDKLGLRQYDDNKIANGLVSDSAKATIDEEVNRLLDEGYKRAVAILKSHRKELDALSEALLNYETLDGDEVTAIMNGKQLDRVKVIKNSNSDKSKGKKSSGSIVGSVEPQKL